MVILLLFEVGFTMLVMAVNQPYKPSVELTNEANIAKELLEDELARCTYWLISFNKINTFKNYVCSNLQNISIIWFLFETDEANPLRALEMLFFALFGLTRPEDLQMTAKVGTWVVVWVKVLFALYLLLTAIVLINLLIAMMSDTYQRIQVKS